MRTCPKCGCYVPDKWITCPTCDARVKIEKEALSTSPYYNSVPKTPNGVYQVKTYYKDGTTSDTIFGMRENALKDAKKIRDQFWYYIEFIEVFDCRAKERIGLFYPDA